MITELAIDPGVEPSISTQLPLSGAVVQRFEKKSGPTMSTFPAVTVKVPVELVFVVFPTVITPRPRLESKLFEKMTEA